MLNKVILQKRPDDIPDLSKVLDISLKMLYKLKYFFLMPMKYSPI